MLGADYADAQGDKSVGVVLPVPLSTFGDSSFVADHRLRYAYVGGSMAKGISSVALVSALGRAGMLGFFALCRTES